MTSKVKFESRGSARRGAREQGYLMTEALVYISAVFVLLGLGFIAMYRCIDNSLVLRRNANDISRAIHAGELWRADVRHATKSAQVRNEQDGQILVLEGASGRIEYRFVDGALYRRAGAAPWGRVLEKVKASSMRSEQRPNVTAWSWDLELQPEARGSVRASHVRPLFTFIAAPQNASSP